MTEKDSKLLLGLGRTMIPVPGALWQRLVARQAQQTTAGLGFMSAGHHRLRDLVVVELPRQGRPLSPAWIAQRLDLPPARVGALLDELEERMTFLFRNPRGEVTWAYPVTVEPTAHHVTLSTGEEVYAA
ncbi:MAG: hypothetical protein PVF47_16470 [Anaerolineae bacterium]|jgi:hypothetical protein